MRGKFRGDRDEFTLCQFGQLAIVLDVNGQLAALAITVECAGRSGGGDSMLMALAGQFVDKDIRRVRRA